MYLKSLKNVAWETLNVSDELFGHGASLTHRAVDARVLVVAEEEALLAATLVAAHGVDARVLAAAVVELALIHICRRAWVRATATRVYKSLTQMRAAVANSARGVAAFQNQIVDSSV